MLDLIGKTINDLTILQENGRKKSGHIMYLCECSCGKIVTKNGSSIYNGLIKSCGNRSIHKGKGENGEYKHIDGMRFGKLVAIKPVGNCRTSKRKLWLCECDCGNFKTIDGHSLRIGNTTSCGCNRKVLYPGRDWREDKKYYEWKNGVREKYNSTCVICGKTSKEIHSHHIIPGSMDIKNRYKIENGVTLCSKCHKKIHSIFGYKEDTTEYIMEHRIL